MDATIITIQRPPKLLEKPGPDTWFRTHYEPAQHPEIQVIVDSRQGIRKKWYVVSPSLRHHFSAHILKRTLYRCMDVYGEEFYFHAKSQESGELDQWNKDKHTAAETAKTRWTLLTLKPGGQGYEIQFADDPNSPEPKWSKRTREESFRLLFADAQITSLDHPYAKYLLGKQIL